MLTLIKKLHSKKIPLVIASSSPSLAVNYSIRKFKLKKYFNKVITIALNKLLRKQLKLNINSPDYIVAFKEQDFADFILELRECALKLDGGE